MISRTNIGGLQVANSLKKLIHAEILPGLDISPGRFWDEFEQLIIEFAPKNASLLVKRDELQQKIDAWHQQRAAQAHDPVAYKAYLQEIGYLLPEGEDFMINTQNIDSEIATQAGPQLVVPVKNARFALNAANARWGSLYDALYGTDVIPETNGAERAGSYNKVRGDKVIAFARRHLDVVAPLLEGSHARVSRYTVQDVNPTKDFELEIYMSNGKTTSLRHPERFIAYRGDRIQPEAILLKNNALHVEIQIDKNHPIGSEDPAGIKDVLVEAAVTTIMDCEDSVAAVDAEDKVEVYSNWLGLMRGNLESSFDKNGKTITRQMNPDRTYTAKDSFSLSLPGRSLLFVRNVGHLMTNNAILFGDDQEIPEGILDAMITTTAALHDLNSLSSDKDVLHNSRRGSIYIVKPKMHGPDEVRFTCDLFSRIEQILNLKPNTIKVGIMDEERRTTVNLKECIRIAKDRLAFINTGFLDRTGDEIHTSMHAGPFVPKTAMKNEEWIKAYEDWNVDVGLKCGLPGKAQIGKGMWAMPDEMAAMLKQKIAHPKSGANTAWVPSPNGATLHSLHYHAVNVFAQQEQLKLREHAKLDDILTIPLLQDPSSLSADEIQAELDNNAQGILGYVVRWVDQGVGCSKVPNIKDVGLMEDRATLRISSQHMANWLLHDIVSKQQILQTMQRMAAVVDKQNAGDPLYKNMSPDFDGHAFKAACDLVFEGVAQPNGYTEPLLHKHRLKLKNA